jgi:hypothetical protein
MLFKDAAITFGWAIILGVPLIVVHMIFFDFEHSQQIDDKYSFIRSITDTVPHTPISLALWLSAIAIEFHTPGEYSLLEKGFFD